MTKIKTRTKAELLEQLMSETSRADGYAARLESILAGKIEGSGTLAAMLGKDRGLIKAWMSQGMPVTKTFLGLQSDFKLGDVVDWRINLEVQVERGKHKMTEDLLLAEIEDLKGQLAEFRDDSVPPPLPQDVIDIMDMSNAVVTERLEDMYDLLADNAVQPGFVDDEDDVLETIKVLGIMQSRIRSALLADFEHYAKERLAVTKERAAKAEAKLAEANAKLAEDLAA